MSESCPNCASQALELVYEVRDIPTHSCLLMESQEAALEFPTGDLDLMFCCDCGFAHNRLFDAKMNAYSPSYEEVQTFSPTFNAFSAELVKRLIEERGLREKKVVEIGCGKGEFLLELCEAGSNRGVGIDPSFVPGRGDWNAGGRVRFINELYSAERHGGIQADAILCRHTLEHIAPTLEFVRTVRASIGDRTDTVVFFEVPDQERVYEERAFWDIYYEHCSYFTAGALERVFLSCGFEILDSWRGFGDQYLLIEARPLAPSESASFRVTEDLERMGERVRAFSHDVRGVVDSWKRRFAEWHADGRKAVIWGAGSKGVAFLTTIGVRDELACAVDINPHKQGYFMPGTGHEVVSPEALREIRPDVVVAMNAIYRGEIGRQLSELGLEPELLAV